MQEAEDELAWEVSNGYLDQDDVDFILGTFPSAAGEDGKLDLSEFGMLLKDVEA